MAFNLSDISILESDCVPGAEEEAAESIPSSLSQLAFSWVTPLISLGSRRQLQHEDMLALPAALEPQHCRRLMWQQWHQACCPPDLLDLCLTCLLGKVACPAISAGLPAGERCMPALRVLFHRAMDFSTCDGGVLCRPRSMLRTGPSRGASSRRVSRFLCGVLYGLGSAGHTSAWACSSCSQMP